MPPFDLKMASRQMVLPPSVIECRAIKRVRVIEGGEAPEPL
jgi:hypothetical protein